MQRRQEPQSRSSGAVGSSSAVGDERAEHDPGAVPARDQHRVLAVEADARTRRGLAVDVLVRIDQDAVLAAEPPSELVEALAEHRVARRATCSGACVLRPARARRRARSSRARPRRRCARRQAASRDGTRPRPGHREAQVGEQAAGTALADVLLRRRRTAPPATRRSRRSRAPRPAVELSGRHGADCA